MTARWTEGCKTTYEYILLSGLAEGDKLDGILPGGSITDSYYTALQMSGQLSYAGPARGWVDQRLRVYMISTWEDGTVERTALGTFTTTTPSITLKSSNAAYAIVMYSLLKVLDNIKLKTTLVVASGSNIVATAVGYITAAGLKVSATDSALTLAADASYEAGKTMLDVINSLLSLANYAQVVVDGYGTCIVAPYVRPSNKPVVWTFKDGVDGIFLPEVTQEYDTYDTPNEVTLIASLPDSVLSATATNSTGNDYSIDKRGLISRVETVEQAPSQAALQVRADDTLARGMQSVESVLLQHTYVPIKIGDSVVFDYTDVNLKRTLMVASMDRVLGNGCLTATRLRWVKV